MGVELPGAHVRHRRVASDGFLLEIALWAEMQAHGLDDILIGLAEELIPKTRQEQDVEAVKQTFRLLQTTPLVFVSLSWIPSLEYDDLMAHGRGYRPSDLRFCAGALPTKEHLELRFHDDEVDYPAMVSIPAYIANDERMKKFTSDCFKRMVDDAAWADRDFPFNWCSDRERLNTILDAWTDLKLLTADGPNITPAA